MRGAAERRPALLEQMDPKDIQTLDAIDSDRRLIGDVEVETLLEHELVESNSQGPPVMTARGRDFLELLRWLEREFRLRKGHSQPFDR